MLPLLVLLLFATPSSAARKRNSRAPAAALSSVASSVASGAASSVQAPDAEKRAQDRFECDRKCRWRHSFFNRSIVGEKTGGLFQDKKCRCYLLKGDGTAEVLAGGELIDYKSKVTFDTETTWSGDFSCPWVCAATAVGELKSMLREDAVGKSQVEIIHCGKCAMCSEPEDVVVLANTRTWITEIMTKTSADYAAPWGHKDHLRLERELTERGINFSTSRRDDRTDLPTCMQCWSDNIMCTRNNCADQCFVKFFDPSNPPSDISNCGALDFHCKCLKCDEEYCGPAFIRCAGANRRSTGIKSDIARPVEQQCDVGKYANVDPGDLPETPKPVLR